MHSITSTIMTASKAQAAPSYLSCPFNPDNELDKSLKLTPSGIANITMSNSNSPNSLADDLPGQPTLSMSATDKLLQFLEKDLLTSELDNYSPYLWLVSSQKHSNIKALHMQLVEGRQINLTEEPRLHLLWIDDHCFIKPLPAYLLSHAFWKRYLEPKTSPLQEATAHGLASAALGYLRTWTYLVQYESDFRLAQQHGLIADTITFADFRRFINNFSSDHIADNDVCPRYHFGSLRLSRLNLYSRFLSKGKAYQRIHWQYWQYFAQLYGPLLFLFGALSVILSAMQVALSTNQVWQSFADTSKWFAVLTLLVIVALFVIIIALLLFSLLDEYIYATGKRREKRNAKVATGHT